MGYRGKILLFAIFVGSAVSMGFAQETDSLTHDGWTVTAGMAQVNRPAFLGSKDYYGMLVPVIRLNYHDKFFASIDEGIGYNVIHNDSWRIGPIAQWEMARSDKDSDGMFRIAGKKTTALNGLDKVGGSLEIGGFAEYTVVKHVKVYGELRQAVNGHEGFRGDFKLTYENQVGYISYALGPRLSVVDDTYNDAYFAISDSVAARTGLAVYSPGAGVLSYGVGGRVIVPFSKQIAAVFFGGYDRLADEAGKSPLVSERGSRHQVTAGIAVVYRLNF